MRVLVWQWGRRGAGPRYGAALADGLRAIPDVDVTLSLSSGAELFQLSPPPRCELPVDTYTGWASLLLRLLSAPLLFLRLCLVLRDSKPDLAICAMPGPLDLVMVAALSLFRVPLAVIVHDADAHPGDGFPLQMRLQRRLIGHAAVLVALTGHVAGRLREQGVVGARPLLLAPHPPLLFDNMPVVNAREEGPTRFLVFGRLLPYKGLDLLAEALTILPNDQRAVFRVVGQGPETATLDTLRRLPFATVENRWVPETEVAALFAWADVVVLSHREASQSGVAAAALAAGRVVVATRVGGLTEQLDREADVHFCMPDPLALAETLRAMFGTPAPRARRPTADIQADWTRMAASLIAGCAGVRCTAKRPRGPMPHPAARAPGTQSSL